MSEMERQHAQRQRPQQQQQRQQEPPQQRQLPQPPSDSKQKPQTQPQPKQPEPQQQGPPQPPPQQQQAAVKPPGASTKHARKPQKPAAVPSPTVAAPPAGPAASEGERPAPARPAGSIQEVDVLCNGLAGTFLVERQMMVSPPCWDANAAMPSCVLLLRGRAAGGLRRPRLRV